MRVAFFLDGAAGKIFCSGALRPEGQAVRGRVLLIPPLLEEMNKSRHVLSAIIREADDAGYDILLPDLFGTGDSHGDFGEATLAIWRSDLERTLARLDGAARLHIVSLRGGALLAADLLARHPADSLILLQPQIDGRQVINQLLRLRVAGSLLASEGKETAAQLRQHLSGGATLEIAGYALSSELALGLEALSLHALPLEAVRRIQWIEISPQPDPSLLPVSQRVIDDWVSKGTNITTSLIGCDQFWATQEIAQCPAVAEAVARQLDESGG